MNVPLEQAFLFAWKPKATFLVVTITYDKSLFYSGVELLAVGLNSL